MVQKKELKFMSSDEKVEVFATVWSPEEGTPVKGVLQIVHGMKEYVGRYEAFAEFLAERGFVVAGEDHLGHGRTAPEDSQKGFFAENNGNKIQLETIRRFELMIREMYPDVPYFLLGHSMGSFLARQYICRYGKDLTGAVIMGTGTTPKLLVSLCRTICRFEAKRHKEGWHYRSTFVENLAMGSYNKRINPLRTKNDWLTKVDAIVDKYNADPNCTYTFTVNGYFNMMCSIGDCQDSKKIALIPKDLPILVTSGAEDPVGGYGAGVQTAADGLKKAGIKSVDVKLYPNDRHEILNETDRETVYVDILGWMEKIIG